MTTPLWYLFTCGIPLLGLLACTVGFGILYRQVKRRQLSKPLAVVSFLLVTLAPIGLALLAINFGSSLAHRSSDYAFYGENTWALVAAMEIYAGLAVLANLAFWVALALTRRRAAELP